MAYMFYQSAFNQNIEAWTPKKLKDKTGIFDGSSLEAENNLPYWSTIDVEFLEMAINAYQLQLQLKKTLPLSIRKHFQISTINKI